MNPQGFDFYLNIDTNRNTYHATIEHGFPPNKEITSIEIPSDVLDEVVALAHNKKFMSLKNKDIFSDLIMMDGYDVRISVKSDAGSVSLDSNMLDDTLWDGVIILADGGIKTPFDKLAAFAFELLGIERDVYEDEEEDSVDA